MVNNQLAISGTRRVVPHGDSCIAQKLRIQLYRALVPLSIDFSSRVEQPISVIGVGKRHVPRLSVGAEGVGVRCDLCVTVITDRFARTTSKTQSAVL